MPPVSLVRPTILDRWPDQRPFSCSMADPDFYDLPTWLLSQATQRAHRLLHDRLDDAGATGYEYRLLSALHAVGEATQADLGRLARLDRRDVTITVRALIASGTVARQRSSLDARAQIVSLTPAGRRRYAQLNTRMQAVQDELLSQLPAAHRDRLLDDLSRIGTQNAARTDTPL
jgi:DNA-binding MarR family transcriptional regulator